MYSFYQSRTKDNWRNAAYKELANAEKWYFCRNQNTDLLLYSLSSWTHRYKKIWLLMELWWRSWQRMLDRQWTNEFKIYNRHLKIQPRTFNKTLFVWNGKNRPLNKSPLLTFITLFKSYLRIITVRGFVVLSMQLL